MSNASYISEGKNRQERCERAAQIHRTLMEMPADSPWRFAGELTEKIERKFVEVWLQFAAAAHKELLPCGVGFTMLREEIVRQNDLPGKHTMSIDDFDLTSGLAMAKEFAEWQVAAE